MQSCIPRGVLADLEQSMHPSFRNAGKASFRTLGKGWLKPENRCLVPFNSFAEYTPEPNPDTKKRDVVWFALGDDRPLTAFAGFRNYYRFYFIQPFSLQNSKPVASISS
jgi:putative SOS response-associated peptidase YedK